MKNADFKLQFDHTRIGAGSTAHEQYSAGVPIGGRVNLISATVDFVF